MTPLVAKWHNEHKQRLERFARAAIVRKPVILRPVPVKVEAAPIPVVEAEMKPEPWFHIVAEVNELGELEDTLSIAAIQRATCRYFGITKLELMARRRTPRIVIPRQIAIYLCKEHTVRSLPEIGRHFGGFDHTTILHNIRITEKRMRSDWRIAFDIAHIEGILA